MNAKCANCGRIVTIEFAERRYSCPECGRDHYIVDTSYEIEPPKTVKDMRTRIDRLVKEGVTNALLEKKMNQEEISDIVEQVMRSTAENSGAETAPPSDTKSKATTEYYNLQTKVSEIRITDMNRAKFKKYVTLLERCLSLLPKVIEEDRTECEVLGLMFELPPVIRCRDYLPEMYMRWGYWEDAKRVFVRCHQIGALSKEECRDMLLDVVEKETAVKRVVEILTSDPAPMKQTDLKKQLVSLSAPAINWALRYYKGISRTKEGSNYILKSIRF